MNPSTRRQARKCIIQALYTWELSKNKIIDIEREYRKNIDTKKVDIKYFHEIFNSIVINCKKIDQKIKLCLDRKLQEIGYIEKAILRLSVYELYNRTDIPYKVSINEGIELAKIFGAQNSHKFINGVLNHASKNSKKYLKNKENNKNSY
ncbi:transcription antitermination factor NusB [Buchnera aphidicola]|uniref:transcription antitermination factor NusB n=1 Tax=Buchnera aphidicola TaxID=9 RepID=UPI0034642D77